MIPQEFYARLAVYGVVCIVTMAQWITSAVITWKILSLYFTRPDIRQEPILRATAFTWSAVFFVTSAFYCSRIGAWSLEEAGRMPPFMEVAYWTFFVLVLNALLTPLTGLAALIYLHSDRKGDPDT